MGDIYFRKGNTDSARYYYHQGVELATKQKGLSQLVTCQMGLAQIYLASGKQRLKPLLCQGLYEWI